MSLVVQITVFAMRAKMLKSPENLKIWKNDGHFWIPHPPHQCENQSWACIPEMPSRLASVCISCPWFHWHYFRAPDLLRIIFAPLLLTASVQCPGTPHPLSFLTAKQACGGGGVGEVWGRGDTQSPPQTQPWGGWPPVILAWQTRTVTNIVRPIRRSIW